MAPERDLIQDDHMVEAFSADRTDHPFHVWALPRRSESGENFVDFHAFRPRPKGGAIDAVPVPELEPRRHVPRKCVQELRCGPLGGRMFRDIEMNDASAIMSKNKKHVQDPETQGRHYEKIDGCQLLDVVFQKRPPGL